MLLHKYHNYNFINISNIHHQNYLAVALQFFLSHSCETHIWDLETLALPNDLGGEAHFWAGCKIFRILFLQILFMLAWFFPLSLWQKFEHLTSVPWYINQCHLCWFFNPHHDFFFLFSLDLQASIKRLIICSNNILPMLLDVIIRWVLRYTCSGTIPLHTSVSPIEFYLVKCFSHLSLLLRPKLAIDKSNCPIPYVPVLAPSMWVILNYLFCFLIIGWF